MKNQGVSAVIGVILMVAITVAIAGTVFVYISYELDKLDKYDLITNKFQLNLDCENCTYYFFEINNKNIVEVNQSVYSSYRIREYWYRDGVIGDGI